VLVMWILDRLGQVEEATLKLTRREARGAAQARMDAEAEETLMEPCEFCRGRGRVAS